MRLSTGNPPVGQYLELDGRRLWVHRSGDSAPAVVFVPGAGAMGLDYLLCHERVAALTTSVIYDRAGTGWSDDVDLPRSLEAVTDELHTLLRLVGGPPPYILVGHSLGGAYVHCFAQRFPSEVAALLLLEPAHPDWDSFMPDHLKLASNLTSTTDLPEFSQDLQTLARAQLQSGMFDHFSDDLQEMLIEKRVSPDRLLVGMREGSNVLSIMDALRAGGPLPDVPLIVMSGTAIGPEQTVFQTEDNLREQISASQRLFDAIAASVSRGEHRALPDASHISLPMIRPDAVEDAIEDLLRQARVQRSR